MRLRSNSFACLAPPFHSVSHPVKVRSKLIRPCPARKTLDSISQRASQREMGTRIIAAVQPYLPQAFSKLANYQHSRQFSNKVHANSSRARLRDRRRQLSRPTHMHSNIAVGLVKPKYVQPAIFRMECCGGSSFAQHYRICTNQIAAAETIVVVVTGHQKNSRQTQGRLCSQTPAASQGSDKRHGDRATAASRIYRKALHASPYWG